MYLSISGATMGSGSIILELFVIFAAAKLAGEVFDRLALPPVVGELVAGALIGPNALGLIGRPGQDLLVAFGTQADAQAALDTIHQLLATLGAVVLLFFVGLESPLHEMLRVGRRAAGVAVSGVVVSFALGIGLATVLGMPPISSLFVGAIFGSTSVGISARVFADLGRLDAREARIVLGAAVIDDILGLIGLTAVSALSRTGGADAVTLGTLSLQALAFVVIAALVCTYAVRRLRFRLELLHLRDAPFVVAMAACFGLAALASRVGLAALVGAFLAGIAFAETREQFELERRATPVYELLVPFFFVLTGSRVDWHALWVPSSALLIVGLVLLASCSKIIGCGLAAWGLGRWTMATVGVGMIPRGELTLIAATIAASLGAISTDFFSAVVGMSVLTTLLAAPLLALLYRQRTAALAMAGDELESAHGVLPEF
jgi:Kef-type K+ transport system membrane component KefB